MAKYSCLCGVKFQTNRESKEHIKVNDGVDLIHGIAPHKIFVSHWQVRLIDWICATDIIYFMAFISGCIINSLIVTRLGMPDMECLLESICAGIFLLRLLKR